MKPTVLVVDDDPSTRRLLCAMFEDAGYSVSDAEHGGPALAQMRASSQPLVVSLGLIMPYVDGEEVLEAVAANPVLATRHRIIMLTANTDLASTGRVAELRRQLGVPLIAKPWDYDQLLAAVAEAASSL